MTFRLADSLKNQMFIFLVITTLAMAAPQFIVRAEAEDTGGFYFTLEGRGSLSEGDSTVWVEEVAGGISFPTEKFATIDTDVARFSGRLGGGYHNGALDFGIFYSGLQAIDDDENFTPGVSINLIVNPLGNATGGIFGISAWPTGSASVTYNVIDFEAGYTLKLGPVEARIFGGMRYADIDQDINSRISRIATPSLYFHEHRDADFWGVGPRLGASANVPISGAFGVSASASGAALFGELYSVTDSGYSIFMPVRTSYKDTRVAGNFDGELGVTFNHQMDNASTMIITLGYRAEAWLDVNDTKTTEPKTIGSIYGTTHADQIFHGPFLRGEWRFD